MTLSDKTPATDKALELLTAVEAGDVRAACAALGKTEAAAVSVALEHLATAAATLAAYIDAGRFHSSSEAEALTFAAQRQARVRKALGYNNPGPPVNF